MENKTKKSDFKYLDGASVDEELKCLICYEPFDSPVCNDQCGHTFCFDCVNEWLKNSSSCPTCRRRVTKRSFHPVTTRAVLNQLLRLRVKCTLCEQTDIDNRKQHLEICPKQMVKCISADLHCQWEGYREGLNQHLEKCRLSEMRPVIDHLKKEIRTIEENQSEQQHFIQAFINNGHILSSNCTANPCRLKQSDTDHEAKVMRCSLCGIRNQLRHIALHSCETLKCICTLCFDKYNEQPVRINRKRRRSSSNESSSGYVNYNRWLPRTLSRSRSRSSSRSPSTSPR
ncbi:hypothetical protein I4U23_027545 [Adineta vaga]|nr:hypothetical protein I4U23_027545 [Adineta vaga]